MTGPEHYRQAERLLAKSEAVLGAASPSTIDDALAAMSAGTAAAQVHATLAQAASTEALVIAIQNLPTYEGMLSVYNFGGDK